MSIIDRLVERRDALLKSSEDAMSWDERGESLEFDTRATEVMNIIRMIESDVKGLEKQVSDYGWEADARRMSQF